MLWYLQFKVTDVLIEIAFGTFMTIKVFSKDVYKLRMSDSDKKFNT